MLPVGAKVMMSEVGRSYYRNTYDNPHTLEGVVILNERKVHESRHALDCVVCWSNNNSNSYDYESLTFAVDLSSKNLEDYL
jgi:hypothetical protein